MKPHLNIQAESQKNVSFDTIAANLTEIREQVIDFGNILQNIVDEIQNVPDARAVDAFKQQVLQKQMVLETLVEENSCTLDLLKHDVVCLNADVQDLKAKFHDLNDARYAVSELLPPTGVTGSSLDAVNALRRHPLSSIPPRQLSEGEAIRFLQAIDEIVTTGGTCSDFNKSASGK